MTDARILVLGGGSDIGQAIARRFARAGFDVQLAARDAGQLRTAARDIALRHDVQVSCHDMDVTDLAGAEAFFDSLPVRPTLIVSVVGWMGVQDEVARDADQVERSIATNLTGPAWALEVGARYLAESGGETGIIGVSSVAGDRGRAANYWYGAAKAGFTAFLSGLRQKYAGSRLHVMTVKPGFVATRMTEGMDLPARLTARPEEVGEKIYRGWEKRRNTLYVKSIWWLVMTIITALPETIFKRTTF